MVKAGGFKIYPQWAVESAYPALSTSAMEPWVWCPSDELKSELPPGWCLALGCSRRPNGDRVFYPLSRQHEEAKSQRRRSAHKGRDFVALVFSGGLALRIKLGQLTLEEAQSYRGMWMLWQRVQRTQAYSKRDFTGGKDIRLTVGSVNDDLVENVDRYLKNARNSKRIPLIISGAFRVPNSTAVGGANSKWVRRQGTSPTAQNFSLQDVLELGTQAAKTDGVSRPSPRESIQYGLIEIARRATHLNVRTPKELVLRALFATPLKAGETARSVRHPLTARILKVLEAHEDDTDARFEKWFWGEHNTFVTQLATPHTKYGPERVKRLLTALGAHALDYVGSCVHVQMRALMRGIDPPLNERERTTFSNMYWV